MFGTRGRAPALVPVAVVALLGMDTLPAQELEDIVVTAERREASLQDVPLAVSALSMDAIDNLQIKEAQDLQRYVPSLNMFNNITQPTNLSPSMRGGLQQDASLVTAESARRKEAAAAESLAAEELQAERARAETESLFAFVF